MALQEDVRGQIASPNLGAVKLAERYARKFGRPLAIMNKSRVSGFEVNVRELVSEVKGLRSIIVDDKISTAGTIEATKRTVTEAGSAPEFTVVATHALLMSPAVERLSGVSTSAAVHRQNRASAEPALPS